VTIAAKTALRSIAAGVERNTRREGWNLLDKVGRRVDLSTACRYWAADASLPSLTDYLAAPKTPDFCVLNGSGRTLPDFLFELNGRVSIDPRHGYAIVAPAHLIELSSAFGWMTHHPDWERIVGLPSPLLYLESKLFRSKSVTYFPNMASVVAPWGANYYHSWPMCCRN
jgi:hypothetical protein